MKNKKSPFGRRGEFATTTEREKTVGADNEEEDAGCR